MWARLGCRVFLSENTEAHVKINIGVVPTLEIGCLSPAGLWGQLGLESPGPVPALWFEVSSISSLCLGRLPLQSQVGTNGFYLTGCCED